MSQESQPEKTQTANFEERLQNSADQIETTLRSLLTDAPRGTEQLRPPKLLAAMQHGVLNGGKRIRPFLIVEVARMLGYDQAGVLRAASALECVHCYSLIHDDLPAMDDDDLRRGKPTVHVAFDEATAILAGDSLLTLAFDILADEATHQKAEVRAALVLGLAQNAGIGGMAGGQSLDIEAEGRDRTEAEIRQMQAMKTGALLRYACEAGAILAEASAKEQAAVTRFGTIIGLAFQLADDLLDVTATSAQLGKTAGKDLQSHKATLVSLNGVDATRETLNSLILEAEETLAPFANKADVLIATARFIANRQH
ncbi:polyprenyl synthetase family protein [Cohaesibacter celericrescens]|uniref:Probable farnesyl diphosphate synthase n=1 Tax=Cohaesibacter celericrescens TaxID=2067669 RepID=A0A2N5XU30_9HYPH|nr:farnesyl diphosphate synthase [Cohaesibacter celericrescens]PLW78026.1 farnesyl-diphosphate synthase [Cohaesibacter celericrescens]